MIVWVSTGCGYSLLSLEVIGKIQEKYSDQLDVVTVWHEPSRKVWLEAAPEYKKFITWTDLWDEKYVFNAYLGSKISPTFVILNPDDEVVRIFKGVNFKKIIKLLDKLERTGKIQS